MEKRKNCKEASWRAIRILAYCVLAGALLWLMVSFLMSFVISSDIPLSGKYSCSQIRTTYSVDGQTQASLSFPDNTVGEFQSMSWNEFFCFMDNENTSPERIANGYFYWDQRTDSFYLMFTEAPEGIRRLHPYKFVPAE